MTTEPTLAEKAAMSLALAQAIAALREAHYRWCKTKVDEEWSEACPLFRAWDARRPKDGPA